MTSSDQIALASLVVACVAFCVSLLALKRSDNNASAQTIIALTLGFRSSWKEFLEAKEERAKDFEFAELCNLLEVACATYLDRAVHGKSRKILRDYLVSVLGLMAADENVRQRITPLRERPDVFEFVKKFAIEMRKSGRLDQFNQIMFADAVLAQVGAGST